MPNSPEEMRLRDVATGLQAELTEANHQREKVEVKNAKLHTEIQGLNERLRMAEKASEASLQLMGKLLQDISLRNTEIADIRKSRTWRIGLLVLTPLRWVKRSKS